MYFNIGLKTALCDREALMDKTTELEKDLKLIYLLFKLFFGICAFKVIFGIRIKSKEIQNRFDR